MAQASFSHPDGTVTFSRAVPRPDRSLAVIQPQRFSAGRTRFGYAHTIINDQLKLRLRMTTAEKDALILFFNSTVKGMSELFAFTPCLGDPLLVRFDEPRLADLQEKTLDAWDVPVTLRTFGVAMAWDSAALLAFDDGSIILGGI